MAKSPKSVRARAERASKLADIIIRQARSCRYLFRPDTFGLTDSELGCLMVMNQDLLVDVAKKIKT